MDKSHITLIKPPYTLDRWKDGASGTRKENEFQRLENYIPVDGGIIVREGVVGCAAGTVVTTTPETTVPPFNPSTDTRCYIILDFETLGGLGVNKATPRTAPASPQATFLFAENVAARTGSATWSLTDYKEGLASLWITNNTSENTAAGSGPNYYGLQRPGDSTTSLRSWVIGAEGSTVKEWLITGWFKITSYKTGAYIWQSGEYNSTDANHIILNTASGSMQLISRWYDQVHGTIVANAITAVSINKWYFFGTWCSKSSSSSALYLYDDLLKTDSYTSTTGLPFTNFFASTSRKTIGGYAPWGALNAADDSEAFPGKIDYITMWGELPAVDIDKLTLIQQIRDLHKAP